MNFNIIALLAVIIASSTLNLHPMKKKPKDRQKNIEQMYVKTLRTLLKSQNFPALKEILAQSNKREQAMTGIVILSLLQNDDFATLENAIYSGNQLLCTLICREIKKLLDANDILPYFERIQESGSYSKTELLFRMIAAYHRNIDLDLANFALYFNHECVYNSTNHPSTLRFPIYPLNQNLEEMIRFAETVTGHTFSKLVLQNLGLETIPDSICCLQALTILNVNGNHLTMLPDSLSTLSQLSILTLKANLFESVPDVIQHLGKLEVLDLSCTNITELPEWFFELEHLKILSLAYTNITSLPERLAEMKELEEIYVQGAHGPKIPLELQDKIIYIK